MARSHFETVGFVRRGDIALSQLQVTPHSKWSRDARRARVITSCDKRDRRRRPFHVHPITDGTQCSFKAAESGAAARLYGRLGTHDRHDQRERRGDRKAGDGYGDR